MNTLEILLKKYPASEYALMAEVRDGAGFNASRSADFLVMSLWPSRGLEMTGMERKSYRNDWQKELKTPAKAENIYQYCDRWYLLTDKENVAKIEEIPLTWGWMHINEKGKLVLYKEAPKLNPVPVSKNFLACLLKRAANKAGWVNVESIQNKIDEAKAIGEQNKANSHKQLTDRYETLAKDVKDFEEVTGIKLLQPKWGTSGKKLGEIVRFIDNGGVEEMKRQITFIKNYHANIGKKIDEFDKIFVEPVVEEKL